MSPELLVIPADNRILYFARWKSGRNCEQAARMSAGKLVKVWLKTGEKKWRLIHVDSAYDMAKE